MVLTPEQIAGIASLKKNYVAPQGRSRPRAPQVGTRQAVAQMAPRPQVPRSSPTAGLFNTAPPPPGGGYKPIDWDNFQGPPKPESESTGVGGSIKGLLGGVVGAGLDAIDVLRAGYQGVAAEVGDLSEGVTDHIGGIGGDALQWTMNSALGNPFQMSNPGNDGTFNPGTIVDRVKDPSSAVGTQKLWGALDSMPGGWQKASLGTVGDIITDPTTYFTLGAGGVVAGMGKGAARVGLAQTIAKNAAREGMEEAGEKLAREAAKRGAAALTKKGLKRAGVSADEALLLAGKTNFGIGVGVGNKARILAPKTRGIAEAVENAKGNIKVAFHKTGIGNAAGLFRSNEFNEKAIRKAILAGGDDVMEKAQQLIRIQGSRAGSYGWVEDASNELADLKGLKGLSKEERRQLTLALDTGDYTGEMSRGVRQWFDKTQRALKDAGVDFKYKDNYVPHRLTEKARRAVKGGDNTVTKYVDSSLDRTERFQAVREMDQTIDEINAAFRAEGHNYDLLETDFHKLAEAYLQEAQHAYLRAGLRSAGDGNSNGWNFVDNLVTHRANGVDDELVDKELKQLAEDVDTGAAESYAQRKAAAKVGMEMASEARAVQTDTIKALKKAHQAAFKAASDLNDKAEKLGRKLAAATDAQAAAERVARAARGAEKGAATRKVTAATAKVEQLARQLDATQKALDAAPRKLKKLKDAVTEAEVAYKQADLQLEGAAKARAAMDVRSPTKAVRDLQDTAANNAAKAAKVRQEFIDADSLADNASDALTWLSVDNNARVQRASKIINEIDDYVNNIKNVKKKDFATNKEAAIALRDRMAGFRDLFAKGNPDPRVTQMASLEAAANTLDWQRVLTNKRISALTDFKASKGMMNSKQFQQYMALQTDQGFARLAHSDVLQVKNDYAEAIETTRHLMDPKLAGPAWKAASYAMDGYMKAYNWWKTFATGTPGFVVRNVYSGMFNMYLDDVAPMAVARYARFHNRFERDGLEATMEWATGKYGARQAIQLREALETSAASGWGQTFSVAAPQTLKKGNSLVTRGKGFGLSAINPVSKRNVVTSTIREASNSAEAIMRGGHALHVLQTGGDMSEALRRVEKFHFNYRDVSDIDRLAKTVSPFFVYFSRNLALQAQMFAQKPFKLNRTYLNLKRNMEWATEDDPDAPEWLAGPLGGFRTPFGGEESGRMYLTPDIPSIRAMEQFANPTMAAEGALGPILKTPFQLLTNEDMFTNRQYKNSLIQGGEDANGNYMEMARLAPQVLQNPVLGGLADLVPGTQRVNGQLLMQDNTQAALESLLPMLGQTSRLAPNMPAKQDRFKQSLAGYLGAPIKWNDPATQSGVQYGREKTIEDAAKEELYQEKLRELTAGNGG